MTPVNPAQAAEKCLRCDAVVVFQMEDGYPTCPTCGWTRVAGQDYARRNAAKVRWARFRQIAIGTGVGLMVLLMIASPRLREAGFHGAIKGTVFFLIGLVIFGIILVARK